MALSIIQLFEESGNAQTKDLVVSVLSNSVPLSIRKIHNQILEKFSYNVTYQATFKAIKELVREGVLSKQKKEYKINVEWVRSLRKFCDKVESQELSKTFSIYAKSLTEGKIAILTFDSLKDADDYLTQLIDRMIETKQGPFLGQVRHLWWPAVYSVYTEKNIIQGLSKAGIKLCCAYYGNKKFDKNIINFYRKLGVKIIQQNAPPTSDTFVMGNNAIQIFYPQEFIQLIDRFYEKHNKISDDTREKFAKELYDKPLKIKLIINRDVEVVEEIVRQIKSFFNA